MNTADVCPGCGREKTRRARLCRDCRRRAIEFGVEAFVSLRGLRDQLADQGLAGVKERLVLRPPEIVAGPITPGQIRGFYGKASALAKLAGEDPDEIHDQALAETSERAGRPIKSVRDLTELEAHRILDEFTTRIRAEKARMAAIASSVEDVDE